MNEEVAQSYNRLLFAVFGETYGDERRIPERPEALVEQMDAVLATLPPDNQHLLFLRFGLSNGQLHSWDDLAREMKMNLQEVKDLELEAMRSMRHPSRSQLLEQFLPKN